MTARKPCGAWSRPLTAAGDPYYLTGAVGPFSINAFRAQDDGRLHNLWAWEVRCGGMSLARSNQRVDLEAAQLAAEDAACDLLLGGLAVLGAGMPDGFAIEWDNPDKWAHAIHLGDSSDLRAVALGMLAAVRK